MLIGDRKKAAVNEVVGVGDGANLRFQLDMFPLASAPTGILTVLLTGTTAATNTYTIDGELGTLTFLAGSVPAAGATILASYSYHALTSGELSEFLSGHTGSPFLAAANAIMVVAADASRLFAYTMGDKTVDKRRVSNSLLELSKELENKHYNQRDDGAYSGTVFTFKDDTGTPYHGYDSAVSYLPTSGT